MVLFCIQFVVEINNPNQESELEMSEISGQVTALARLYMNGMIPFKETIEQSNKSCYTMTLSGINYN